MDDSSEDEVLISFLMLAAMRKEKKEKNSVSAIVDITDVKRGVPGCCALILLGCTVLEERQRDVGPLFEICNIS